MYTDNLPRIIKNTHNFQFETAQLQVTVAVKKADLPPLELNMAQQQPFLGFLRVLTSAIVSFSLLYPLNSHTTPPNPPLAMPTRCALQHTIPLITPRRPNDVLRTCAVRKRFGCIDDNSVCLLYILLFVSWVPFTRPYGIFVSNLQAHGPPIMSGPSEYAVEFHRNQLHGILLSTFLFSSHL